MKAFFFTENYVHIECETKNRMEYYLISVLTNNFIEVSPTEDQAGIRIVLAHV